MSDYPSEGCSMLLQICKITPRCQKWPLKHESTGVLDSLAVTKPGEFRLSGDK